MPDDPPVTVAPRPAIPSRAAGEAAPSQPPPMFTDPGETAAAPKPKRSARPKKTTEKLSAAEIHALNAKRRKALAKKQKVKRSRRKPAHDKHRMSPTQQARARYDAAPAPRNPNRPLELKNQLVTIMSIANTLRKPAFAFFTQAIPALQRLTRSDRRKVIAALAQVYG